MGNLVIAIHPRMLGDADAFYKNAGEVLERVRNAERLPGVDAIIIPGELEAQKAAARYAAGTVPIESNMLTELRKMAADWDTQSVAAPRGGAHIEAALLESNLLSKLDALMSRLDRLEQRFDSMESAVSHGTPSASIGSSSTVSGGLAELKARAAAAVRFGTTPVNNHVR